MPTARTCFNVVNLRGEFVDIGAPHIASHGTDGAVHITGYGTSQIHMESETKHVAGTQLVEAKDNNSQVIFSTNNETRTIGFDTNCTVDFNNCTVANLAGGGGGGLPINGTGDISVVGNISASGDGISTGKVEGHSLKATAGNIVSSSGSVSAVNGDVHGNALYTNTLVYNQTENGGVVTNTEYTLSQNCAKKDGGVNELSAQQFTNYHQFTQPLILSNAFKANANAEFTNGNLTFSGTGQQINNQFGAYSGDTANLLTQLTCGSINVSNGANNFIRCPIHDFREGNGGGITISQPASGDANQNSLLFKQVGAGSGSGMVFLKENGSVGTADDENLRVDEDGQVRLRERINVPQINFRQDSSGGFSLSQGESGGPFQHNLGLSFPNPSSSFMIMDENQNSLLVQTKNSLNIETTTNLNQNTQIANTRTFSFGSYTFTPTQYTYAFTGAVIDDNPAVLFNSNANIFTNVNTGATSVSLNTAGEGYYKLTITGSASSGGTYGAFRFSCDFPYTAPAFAAGTVINRYTGNFSGAKYPASGITTPDLCGFSLSTTDYKLCWPSIASGTETFSGTLTITRMPY